MGYPNAALELGTAVGDALDGQLAQLHLVARQRPRLVAEHVLHLRAAAQACVKGAFCSKTPWPYDALCSGPNDNHSNRMSGQAQKSAYTGSLAMCSTHPPQSRWLICMRRAYMQLQETLQVPYQINSPHLAQILVEIGVARERALAGDRIHHRLVLVDVQEALPRSRTALTLLLQLDMHSYGLECMYLAIT